MEDKRMWQVLEIEPVKDEDKIRAAYRKKLMHTNPEDDAEGFKLLRESYEQAINWARTSQEEEEQQDTPMKLWIKQVEACYDHLPQRLSYAAWKELLSNELCQALDTSNEALEELLAFLASHYYLPQKIWQLICRTFCIADVKAALYEKFPKDFIDYVLHQADEKDFIDFTRFEGPDDGDYDAFIRQYFDLKSLLDERKLEEAEKALEKLEKMGISHPLLVTEKMRLAVYTKHLEDAGHLADALEAQELQLPYIQYFIGMARWEKGEIEAAGRTWKKLLEDNPEYYWAKYELIKYDMQTGSYEEAKQYTLDLMDILGNQQSLMDQLMAANEKLLVRMEEEWQQFTSEEQLNHEAKRFEIAWCYFQNKRFKACDKLLEYTPSEEYTFEYDNLKGRNDLADERYNEALPFLLKWLEAIEKMKEDGTEKTKKRLERKGYAYYTVGACYQGLKQLEKASHYYEIGANIQGGDRVACQERLAYVYLELHKNEKCVDVCNSILEQDDRFYPAYLHRQKAYFHLGDGQHVIEDFYHCIQLLPGFYEPYQLAMKTFMNYGQLENALDIFDKAKGNDVLNQPLRFYYYQCQRLKAEKKEDLEKIIEALKKIQEEEPDKENSKELPAEIDCEIAMCYMQLGSYEAAYSSINGAITHAEAGSDTHKPRYLWIKADILVKLGKYMEALALHDQVAGCYPNNAGVYYDRAENLEKLNRTAEAVKDYEKVIELAPDHKGAYGRLADIYIDRYEALEKREDYKQAVLYAQKQLENNPNGYYYVSQGLVYLEGYELEKAIESFEKAIKDNPDDLFPYNNMGYTYKVMGRYDEAIAMCQKAVSKMKCNESLLPYFNLAVCYLIKGEYEKAVENINKDLKLFPNSLKCRKLLEEIYGRMQHYDDQISCYKEDRRLQQDNKSLYYRKMGDAYCNKHSHIKAIYYYRKHIENNPQDAAAYITYADYLWTEHRWYYLAEKKYLLGLHFAKEQSDEYIDICINLARMYRITHQPQKAKSFFDKAMEAIRGRYGSLEHYLAYPGYAPLRHYNVGMLYAAVGDSKTAGSYFEKMLQLTKCKNCHYHTCYEALVGRAVLEEAAGRLEAACRLYKEALAIAPNDDIASNQVRRLAKRLKGAEK